MERDCFPFVFFCLARVCRDTFGHLYNGHTHRHTATLALKCEQDMVGRSPVSEQLTIKPLKVHGCPDKGLCLRVLFAN